MPVSAGVSRVVVPKRLEGIYVSFGMDRHKTRLTGAAAAQDNDSLVVTQALATKDNLKTISDLGPYAKDLVLGSAPEFKTRQQGVLGLKAIYGLEFKDFKALDNAGPQTVSALQHGDAD